MQNASLGRSSCSSLGPQAEAPSRAEPFSVEMLSFPPPRVSFRLRLEAEVFRHLFFCRGLPLPSRARASSPTIWDPLPQPFCSPLIGYFLVALLASWGRVRAIINPLIDDPSPMWHVATTTSVWEGRRVGALHEPHGPDALGRNSPECVQL